MFGTLSQNEHARRSNEITCRAQSEARMTASQPSTGYDHHPAPKMGCLLELPRGQRQPAMVSGLVHAPCTCSQRTSKAASRGRSGQWCKSASVKEGSIGGSLCACVCVCMCVCVCVCVCVSAPHSQPFTHTRMTDAIACARDSTMYLMSEARVRSIASTVSSTGVSAASNGR